MVFGQVLAESLEDDGKRSVEKLVVFHSGADDE